MVAISAVLDSESVTFQENMCGRLVPYPHKSTCAEMYVESGVFPILIVYTRRQILEVTALEQASASQFQSR